MGEGEKVFFDILFYVAKNGCVTAAFSDVFFQKPG